MRDLGLSRELVTVWLACDCQQDTAARLVTIGSVVVCAGGHGPQRVIGVIG